MAHEQSQFPDRCIGTLFKVTVAEIQTVHYTTEDQLHKAAVVGLTMLTRLRA